MHPRSPDSDKPRRLQLGQLLNSNPFGFKPAAQLRNQMHLQPHRSRRVPLNRQELREPARA